MSFLRAQEKKKAEAKNTEEIDGNNSIQAPTTTNTCVDFSINADGATNELGRLDQVSIAEEIAASAEKKKRSSYFNWSDKNRYDIGKYASQYGNAGAVRHYQSQFPKLKESTVRDFKKKYESELNKAKKAKREPATALRKYTTPTGRPLLLGKIDSMVQTYITALSNRGAVISRCVANATAKALMKKYPNEVGNIDIESSYWAKSLFKRMNYARRRKTSSKVDIPQGARKEIEFLYLHNIVSKVEKYNIPSSLIINLDQTPSKYVPVGNSTMAKKGEPNVTITGSSDKRTITATFAITMRGDFLPMQLIYGGKTKQSLPRFKFPPGFSTSANPKHYSNTEESLKYFNEVILPYVQRVRTEEGLPENQMALVVMDVFTGQTTPAVLDRYAEKNVSIENVPANMTKYYQPLDLTINGYGKKYTKKKFNEWYSDQVSIQLANGIELEIVDVKLRLSMLKPIHAGWLVDLYNHMTTSKGKEVILSGWRASGITDAIRLGLKNLPSIDPFDEIDPMIATSSGEDGMLRAICNLSPEEITIGYVRNKDEESDEESDDDEWVCKGEESYDPLRDFDDEED